MLKVILFSCTIAVGGTPFQASFEFEDFSTNTCKQFAGLIEWLVPKINEDARANATCSVVDETVEG